MTLCLIYSDLLVSSNIINGLNDINKQISKSQKPGAATHDMIAEISNDSESISEGDSWKESPTYNSSLKSSSFKVMVNVAAINS